MKVFFMKFVFLGILFAVSISIPGTWLQAKEVDFSCMNYLVKGKIQVSKQHKEYDIILENHCPGAVYWSMCIERIDPWTNKVQEELTPSGIIQMHKKSKVNLQMKNRQDKSGTREAFQGFYLGIGYALKPPARARCFANGCELKKRDLRANFRANDAAWQKAKQSLEDRVATECPQSGWDNSTADDCEVNIRSKSQAQMDKYEQKDTDLKNRISAIDPEQCQVHAGG